MMKRAVGLVLVACLAACTSLLGDFTVTPGDATDAGDLDVSADAAAGDAGGDAGDAGAQGDAAPATCGGPLEPCCAGTPTCAKPGYVCSEGACKVGTAADLGKHCAANADCSLEICAPLADGGLPGVCSETCDTQACPKAPNWTCVPSASFGGADICTCDGTLLAKEVCDGLDNDCNGRVDDGADAECQSRTGAGAVCKAGACACSGPMCGVTCPDMQSDPSNCGACGHACHGASCVAGACQPLVVWDVTPALLGGVATDPASVYFAVRTGSTDGSIQACGNGDGACPGGVQVVYKTLVEPVGVASFGADLIAGTQPGDNSTLVSPSRAFTCPPSNCVSPAVEGSASPGAGLFADIATDGAFVVWLDQGVGGGRIFAATVGASSAIPLVPDAAGVTISALTIANGRVFWSQTTAAGGAVMSCPVSATVACAAGTTTTEMTGLTTPLRIATDGATVLYAVDRGTKGQADGAIYTCTFPCASNRTMLAGQQANPTDVVFDATNVYWTSSVTQGAIRGCARAACTPRDLAGQTSPANLAQDQMGTLYWTVGSLLMRIAK